MRRLTIMPGHNRGQRGLSLVELMIGVALGLFITAGAATLFVSNLTNSRRMLIEARMDQDLRAAADLIARDLRRAGYWGDAVRTTLVTAAGTTVANPYSAITVVGGSIDYAYSPSGSTCALGSAPCSYESYKFDVDADALRMQLDSSVDPLQATDPNVMRVEPNVTSLPPTSISLGASCSTPCTNTSYANCPTVNVRRYTINLVGISAGTKDIVRRELTTTVRIRNDQINGNCP